MGGNLQKETKEYQWEERTRLFGESLRKGVWTRIFHVHPHSIGETRFLFVKNCFLKKKVGVATYFIYFKGKIKQERKTLKCDSIIFGKSMSLKNPSLSPGTRLPIGKVPLKGSTPLSPTKVFTNKVKGSVAINQLTMDT